MGNRRMLSRCITVEAVGLHYAEAGTGEPVVLLHGFPTWSYLWREVQPLLAERSLHTFAVDLMGFGRSDKPEYRDLGVAAQADLVAGFIVTLGVGPVALVGHDLGAVVAQQVAAKFPGVVSRLVLVSPLVEERWPTQELERFRPAELARRTTVDELVRHLRETFPLQTAARTLDAAALEGYLAPWSTPAGMGAFFQLARSAQAATLDEVAARRSKLWAPTLVLAGQEDAISPVKEATALVKTLPAATLETLREVGHLAPEEAPREVAEAISSFLARTSRLV